MIVCMAAASIVFLIFAYLFLSADENVAEALVDCCKETQVETIKKTQIELNLLVEEMKRRNKLDDQKKIKQGKAFAKKIKEAKKLLEDLDKGKLSVLDMIPLAGYRLIQMMEWDATNDVVKRLYQQCVQFKEKKEAMNYTYYLLSSLIGNMMLGVAASLALWDLPWG